MAASHKIDICTISLSASLSVFFLLSMQTPLFNGIIMTTILLNSITIAMETTSLRTSIPLFFISTDAIFLGVFILEFVMKV